MTTHMLLTFTRFYSRGIRNEEINAPHHNLSLIEIQTQCDRYQRKPLRVALITVPNYQN